MYNRMYKLTFSNYCPSLSWLVKHGIQPGMRLSAPSMPRGVQMLPSCRYNATLLVVESAGLDRPQRRDPRGRSHLVALRHHGLGRPNFVISPSALLTSIACHQIISS